MSATEPIQPMTLSPIAGARPPRLAAAIELGTTSVRMTLAQVDDAGNIMPLESLQQAISLGRDTFTRGYITRDTTEECVKALKSFRNLLKQYHVTDPRDILAVATSAVREATNRDAFLDRVFVATEIPVRAIEDNEVNRFTYLGVEPLIRKHAALMRGFSLVLEVGGGTTESLLFNKGRIVGSHGWRYGSLRMRKTLEEDRVPAQRMAEMMTSYVDRAVAQIVQQIPAARNLKLLALGGDIRFACAQALPNWDRKSPIRLSAGALHNLVKHIADMTVDDLVREFRIPYPDAETAAPALMVYDQLAVKLKLTSLTVLGVTLREGILGELAHRGLWTDDFRNQIVSSAIEVGKRYQFDQEHAERVAALSLSLLDTMTGEHRLDSRHKVIINVAAMLHEIGNFVSTRSHHKHSMYLIMNSDVFGLGPSELLLAGLVARYHRKTVPRPTHEFYGTLSPEARVTVAQMSAILRVADAAAKCQAAPDSSVHFELQPGTLSVILTKAGDLTMEKHIMREKCQLFEQVFGSKVQMAEATEK